MSFKDTWDNSGTGGKIGIIVGGCCIGLILLTIIGAIISPDTNTTNSTESNNTGITTTDNNTNNNTNDKNTSDNNTVTSQEYKNTYNLKETGTILMDGKNVAIGDKIIATVTEYPSTESIDKEILDKDPECIIKEITPTDAIEIEKITNKKGVYEYLANHGMFFSFTRNGKTYIVKTIQDDWKPGYLSEITDFCRANGES